ITSLQRIDDARITINTDRALSNAQRAARIRFDLLPPTRTLLNAASGRSITVQAVRDAHQPLVNALVLQAAEFEDTAKAFETADPALLTTAGREGDRATTELTQRVAAVT